MADASVQVPSSTAKTPTDFLNSIKGKPVIVKLNSGVDYKGEGITSTLTFASPAINMFWMDHNVLWMWMTCRTASLP